MDQSKEVVHGPVHEGGPRTRGPYFVDSFIINTGDPEIIKPVNKGPIKDDPSFTVTTGDKEIDKLILEFSRNWTVTW